MSGVRCPSDSQPLYPTVGGVREGLFRTDPLEPPSVFPDVSDSLCAAERIALDLLNKPVIDTFGAGNWCGLSDQGVDVARLNQPKLPMRQLPTADICIARFLSIMYNIDYVETPH